MKIYNFDKIVERHGTDCVKYDGMKEAFGRSDIIPMWIADMDFEVSSEIVDACSERLRHPVFGYSQPSTSYWQSIMDWQSDRNNFHFSINEVCFVPGIVKGLAFAVCSLTNPGDKIVIQPPVYHPFRRVIEQNGREAVTNPLIHNSDGTYEMDIEGLDKVITEQKPKMLILCNPHNPIGISWNPDTLRSVADVCHRNGVIVVSDEIHGDLIWRGGVHTPFASVSDKAADISVTFGAPSKTFNIPGFVSSWCVVKNSNLRSKFFEWLESKELNAVNITSTVATQAAYSKGGEWLEQAKDYIEKNIEFAVDFINNEVYGISTAFPQATYMLWLDCRGMKLSHFQLVDFFINEARIALSDGAMFGHEGNGYMRMNIALPRAVLREALCQLRDAASRKFINEIK